MSKSAIALPQGLCSERKVVRRIADVDSDVDVKHEKFQAQLDEMIYLIKALEFKDTDAVHKLNKLSDPVKMKKIGKQFKVFEQEKCLRYVITN